MVRFVNFFKYASQFKCPIYKTLKSNKNPIVLCVTCTINLVFYCTSKSCRLNIYIAWHMLKKKESDHRAEKVLRCYRVWFLLLSYQKHASYMQITGFSCLPYIDASWKQCCRWTPSRRSFHRRSKICSTVFGILSRRHLRHNMDEILLRKLEKSMKWWSTKHSASGSESKAYVSANCKLPLDEKITLETYIHF